MNSPRSQKHSFRKKPDLLRIAFFLSGIQGLAIVLSTISEKSLENSFLFGLSLSRLVLALIIFCVSTIFLGLAVPKGKQARLFDRIKNYFDNKPQRFVFFFLWGSLVFFILQLKPYFGLLVDVFQSLDPDLFYQRLRPALLWLFLTSLEFGLAIFLSNLPVLRKIQNRRKILYSSIFFKVESLFFSKNYENKFRFSRKPRWKNYLGLTLWVISTLMFFAIFISRIGVIPDQEHWNAAGVPMLPQQMVFLILLTLFLLDLKCIISTKKWGNFYNQPIFSVLLVLGIWLIAILIWNSQELFHTYFAPGPYPPNYEHYPFSDASRFDIGSQYFLMGKGLNQNNLTDRPFMMLYVALLHLIGGQQYDTIIFVQIIFLALIPVFVYLIGAQLHSKLAGVSMALISILIGKNAINVAYEAGIINPKVIMSELPNALLLAIMTYFVIKWLADEQDQLLWPILAGGILGLAVGVRGNSLAIFPVVLVLIAISYGFEKRTKKFKLLSSLFFTIAFVAVLFPYSYHTYKNYGAPFWFTKIQFVIERSANEESQTEVSPKELKISHLSNPNEISGQTGQEIIGHKGIELPENRVTLTIRHMINNEMRTLFIYPLELHVTTLDEIVTKPFWDFQSTWADEISTSEVISIIIYLFILSMGIGFAFNHWQIAGLTPLFIHLGYNLSNSVARTSGGRYVMPTDWALHIYLVLGFLAVIYCVRHWEMDFKTDELATTQGKKHPILILSVLAGFLLLGYSYTFSNLFTTPYNLGNPIQSIGQVEQDVLNQYFDSEIQIDAFRNSPEGFFEIGLVLYPRYFRSGENMDRSSYIPIMPDDQNRIYFLLLTEDGPEHINIILGDQKTPKISNAKFGILVGCDQGDYIDGKVFLPLGSANKSTEIVTPGELNCGDNPP